MGSMDLALSYSLSPISCCLAASAWLAANDGYASWIYWTTVVCDVSQLSGDYGSPFLGLSYSYGGAPGCMAMGGVFRTPDGSVTNYFHTDEGVGFAFLAELLAAITALEWAQRLALDFIWLEADSIYVVILLSSRSLEVSWILKARWRAVIHFIDSIHFCVSHIYREGNGIADLLSSNSLQTGFWSFAIPCIIHAVKQDFYGPGYFRFS
ncbi:hypothetical protein C2S52_001729 [Perilla frutescens var. hirtella]|nr:hypothetical protein C2S51_006813 [Perilla frutescens var. frutescens]KAH6801265.1 hypothetical protein C2S52_001729 [Perilla frutescens var. hirtella]